MTKERVLHYLDGKYVESQGNQWLPLHEPISGKQHGEVALASQLEIDAAIGSASAAFPQWSTTSHAKRMAILHQFISLLTAHREPLAKAVSREHGKLYKEALASVDRGVEVTQRASSLYQKLGGHFLEDYSGSIDVHSIRQPLGICLSIAPFNFPVMIPLWLTVPAIACGNVVILKPSEQVPSASNIIAELLSQAGLPKGVLNILHGDGKLASQLIKHEAISGVTAIGSTPVMESVYNESIAHQKRVRCFGGAKNHCYVAPDADIGQAVPDIVASAYGSAGQRCMALTVVVIQDGSHADSFVSRLKEEVTSLRVGGDDDDDFGPLSSEKLRHRVIDYIQSGVDEGAELVVDGRGFVSDDNGNGFYLGPSLFDHVNEQMRIYQDEIFGPVLCVVRVKSEEEATSLMARHPLGNSAVVYTQSGGVAKRFAQTAQAGMIGINVPVPVPPSHLPFGGWKRSRFGDLGLHGDETVHFYTRSKSIMTRWS